MDTVGWMAAGASSFDHCPGKIPNPPPTVACSVRVDAGGFHAPGPGGVGPVGVSAEKLGPSEGGASAGVPAGAMPVPVDVLVLVEVLALEDESRLSS